MARLIAMYKTPADAKAFDDYYYSTHVPIAKKIPGLKSYEVSTGQVGTPAGPAPYHLIATLSFARRPRAEEWARVCGATRAVQAPALAEFLSHSGASVRQTATRQ